MLADVIIFVYEVPFIFWHYINVDEVSQESLSKNYYKVRWTVITNCDRFFITKCDTVYYKLRQVLQSAMDLLQIATVQVSSLSSCIFSRISFQDLSKLLPYYYQWKRITLTVSIPEVTNAKIQQDHFLKH